jgi:hypothetical protein
MVWGCISHADFKLFLTVLVDRRLLGSQCCLSMGLVANGIRLTKHCNVLSLRSDVTRGLPDLGKSFTNNTGCPIDVCQQEQLETV